MKEYQVVKILREPEKETLRIDDQMTIEFWSVAAVLRGNGEEYESAVTFESLEEARKLKIEDVFLR